MSSVLLSQIAERIHAVGNRDFCPWANRYVYWLKEPVGWFVAALLASLPVGAFLSPLGWSVAAGLATLIAFGLGFPWLATRFAPSCKLANSSALRCLGNGLRGFGNAGATPSNLRQCAFHVLRSGPLYSIDCDGRLAISLATGGKKRADQSTA